MNLCANAVKFTEQGEVVIGVSVEERRDDRVCLHFTVADTGIGIAPGQQRRIFTAFEQADGSTTREYGGTGLGLSIASKLVGMMNGGIWVESDEGAGSTFHFTSWLIGGVAHEPAGPVPSDRLVGLPVLVVDDNRTNRRYLSAELRQWGMEPCCTPGGAEALAHLRKDRDAGQQAPLVVLDACMPDVGGFVVAEAVHTNPSLAAGIVMMLSPARHDAEVSRCRELGIGAYVAKPVRPSALAEAIQAVVSVAAEISTSADQAEGDATHGELRRMRILLAGQNEMNQQLVMRWLRRWGAAVTVAGCGEEAVSAFEREEFDLILMDLQLPDMSCSDVVAALRKLEVQRGGRVPILAITSGERSGERSTCLKAGLGGCVAKPIRGDELLQAIRSVVPSVV